MFTSDEQEVVDLISQAQTKFNQLPHTRIGLDYEAEDIATCFRRLQQLMYARLGRTVEQAEVQVGHLHEILDDLEKEVEKRNRRLAGVEEPDRDPDKIDVGTSEPFEVDISVKKPR